jgi:hypothetical protein
MAVRDETRCFNTCVHVTICFANRTKETQASNQINGDMERRIKKN